MSCFEGSFSSGKRRIIPSLPLDASISKQLISLSFTGYLPQISKINNIKHALLITNNKSTVVIPNDGFHPPDIEGVQGVAAMARGQPVVTLFRTIKNPKIIGGNNGQPASVGDSSAPVTTIIFGWFSMKVSVGLFLIVGVQTVQVGSGSKRSTQVGVW